MLHRLLYLFCFLIWTLQSMAQIPPSRVEYIAAEDEARLEELKTLFGKNKSITPDNELPILVALSHYPELKKQRIVFKLGNKSYTKTSFIKNKSKRTYVIACDINSLPYNAQVGAVGALLSEVLDLRSKGWWEVFTLPFKKTKYKKTRAKIRDNRVMKHNLEYQLLAYKEQTTETKGKDPNFGADVDYVKNQIKKKHPEK